MIWLSTIALILLGLISMVVLLMAMPIEIDFEFEQDQRRKNEARLVWLFGLVRVPLGLRPDSKPKDETVEKHKKKEKSKHKASKRSAVRLMRDPRFRQSLLSTFRRIVNCIRVKRFDFRMRLGLDDPADTGQLWGMLSPLSSILTSIRNTNIEIQPEFTREVFTCHCRGNVKVVPIRVLVIATAFFLNPNNFRALVFSK